MYHVPHDSGASSYSYREGRRSTPSYALVPHSSNSTRRVQYATTRYNTEPTRYRNETRYYPGTTRYHSEPRIYADSRDRIDTYQEQRYVVPYNSSTHGQYRTSHSQVNRHHDGQWVVPARYSQYSSPSQYGHTARAYKYRRQVVDRPVPICACVIM